MFWNTRPEAFKSLHWILLWTIYADTADWKKQTVQILNTSDKIFQFKSARKIESH